MNTENPIDVLEILPHRPPFLFVSRVISIEEGAFASAEYDVPTDLPAFRGHFPDRPVLPGVIILEMMAQTGALAVLSKPEWKGKIAYLAGIEKARFKRPISPGETIRAEAKLGPMKRGIGRAEGTAYVGDEVIATATVVFAVPS